MAGSEQTITPLPTSDAAFLTDLQRFLRQEDAERFSLQFASFVVSGGTHGTAAGLVGTPAALVAFPGGYYVTETGSITYPDATSFVWVIAHKDIVGDVGTFTRVAGTHYLIESNAVQPALPADCVYLMRVTTAGAAITAVTDLRALSPLEIFTAGATQQVGWDNEDGVSSSAARADHVHLDRNEVSFPLTNQTGGALAIGDVVTPDSANNTSVVLEDVQSTLKPLIVSLQAPASGASGRFAYAGLVLINVTGAVTRGNYLRKSATTKVAEDAGAAPQATVEPPAGAFAIATTSAGGPGLGTVTAILLQRPHVAVASAVATQTFRGLRLRTDPGSSLAASQVLLQNADAIVLDDGEEVGPWDRFTADITVSGAGGLDTGGEAASVWYEIYAIRNKALSGGAPAAAPAVATSGGGNIDVGTHSWRVTFVTGAGETSGSPPSERLTLGSTQQVDLTAIPLGPAGTTARKVYRTKAGDDGSYFLVATISDNTTTTYTDNTADSALGAAIVANRALLLHRAKDYFEDETSTAGEDGTHSLRTAATTNIKLGQSFTVDTAGPVEFIEAKLIKAGTPAGGGAAIWFTIEADVAGSPSGVAMSTSPRILATEISTTAKLYAIPFVRPANLAPGVTYWLVLQGNYTVSAGNNIGWRADTTAAGYANGLKASFDGTTWTTDSDDDFIFKVFVTRNDTPVTMPSGFDQKALIGYVYNDSGSNFLPFVQRGRRVITEALQQTGNFTDTVATLRDMSAFLPPRPVLTWWYGGTSSLNGYSVIGGVPDGFQYASAASDKIRSGFAAHMFTDGVAVTDGVSVSDAVPVEFQRVYTWTTAGTAVAVLTSWEW